MKKKISKVITPAVLAASFTVNSFGVSAVADDGMTIENSANVTDEAQDGEDMEPAEEKSTLPEEPLNDAVGSEKTDDTEPKPDGEDDAAEKIDTAQNVSVNEETDQEEMFSEVRSSDLMMTSYPDEEFMPDFENHPKAVYIDVWDNDSQPIIGLEESAVTIELRQNGESKGTGSNDSNGHVFIDSIENGTYDVYVVKAPDGYKSDYINRQVTLNDSDSDEYAENRWFDLCLKKEPTAEDNKIIIEVREDDGAKDTTNGKLISGVTVELYKNDTKIGEQQTTDGSGQISFIGMETGTANYKVKIISAPEEYSQMINREFIIDDLNIKSLPFKLTLELIKDTEQVNEKTIEITAKDQKTGKPIVGATFYVMEDADEKVSTPTDDTGKATITGLTGTDYVVKEKYMPEGYTLDSNRSQTVHFSDKSIKSSGEWAKLSTKDENMGVFVYFEDESGNRITGDISVIIYQYDESKEDHKGSQFGSRSYTADENGNVILGDIVAGKYVMEYSGSAFDSYISLLYPFEISQDQLEVNAYGLKATLELQSKYSNGVFNARFVKNGTDQGISGVQILVESTDGKGYSQTHTSDTDGNISIEIPKGSYKFKITKADGYAFNPSEERTFELTDKIPKYSFTYTLAEGIEIPYASDSVVIRMFKQIPDSQDTSNPVNGNVEAELLDSGKRHLRDFTIEAGQEAVLEHIDPGTYYIRFKSVSGNYTVDATKEYEIIKQDKVTLIKSFGILEKEEESDVYTLTLEVKTKSGDNLDNVSVKVTYADGNPVGTAPDGVYTSESGKIVIPNVDQNIIKYTITNVPDGYINNPNVTYTLNFGENKKAERSYKITVYKLEEIENSAYNIYFFDSSIGQNPIDGFEIEVYKGTSTTEGKLETVSKTGDGHFKVTGLSYGTYTIKFTDTPDGYKGWIGETKEFEVSAQTSEDSPMNYGIPISKKDAPSVQQGTMKFKVQDASASDIYPVTVKITKDGFDGQELKFTDSYHEISFTDNPGVYKYEVTEAPEKYELDNGSFNIVSNESDTKTITLAEVKGIVTVTVNGVNEEHLQGVTVKLGDSSLVATREGNAFTFNDVGAGTYAVKIEGLPDGYEGATEGQSVTISRTSKAQSAEYTFTKSEMTCQYTLNVQADGKFVKGLQYVVKSKDGQNRTVASGTIDNEAQQTFDLPYTVDGTSYKLELTPPDGYKITGSYQTDITINSSTSSQTVTIAEKKGSVKFTIVDDEDKPVTGSVHIDMTYEGEADEVTVSTSGSNEVTKEGLKEGKWNYSVEPNDTQYELQSGTVDIQDGTVQEKEIKLETVSRTVKVKTNASGEDVTVELKPNDGKNQTYTQTGSGSEFTFSDVKAGSYDLTVSSKTYKSHTESLEINRDTVCTSEKTVERTIDLSKKVNSVSFTIAGADPDDHPSVTVNIYKVGQNSEAIRTKSTTEGSLEIEDLEYGDYYYTYTVDDDKYKDYTAQDKTFTIGDQVAPQTIALEKSRESATVTFNVHDDDHKPVDGVELTIKRKETSYTDTFTITKEGKELSPAAYTYEVTDAPKEYLIGQTGEFDLTEEDQNVEITLQAAVGSATVSVHDDAGHIVSGVTVKVKKQGEEDPGQELEADGGTAVFNSLKAGTYDVTITTPDGYTVGEESQTITIDRDHLSETADFTLTQQKRDFTFNITAEGRETAGVTPTVEFHIYKGGRASSDFIGTYKTSEWTGDNATLSLQLPDGDYHCWYQVKETGLWNSNIPGFEFSVNEGNTSKEIKLIKKQYAMSFQTILRTEGPATDVRVKYTVDGGDEKFFTIKSGSNFLFGSAQNDSGENTVLEPGRKYVFEIVDLPEGYTISKDMADAGKIEFTMSAYLPYGVGSAFYIDYHSHENVTFNFQDENGYPVQGVKYTITRLNGADYKGNSIWTGTTEETSIIEDLEYGSYTLQITAPEDYKLDGSDFVSFDVSEDSSKDITTKLYKLIYGTATINVKNNGVKIETPVTVQITGPNGTSSQVINNGMITIPKLLVGDYTVSVTAAEGYLIDNKTYSFTIDKSGEKGTDETVEITLMTTEQAADTYSVPFTLTDTDAEAVQPNGVLKIYKTGDSTDLVGEYQFSEGNVTVKGLPAGNYRYEVELDGKYREIAGGTFTVNDRDLDTIALTTTEKKATLIISTGLTEAKGVKVTVGKETKTLENGKAEFTNIPYGEYDIYIQVPNGYVLSGSSVRHVVIDNDRESVYITLSEQRCSIRVRVTDEFTGLPLKASTGGKLTFRNKDTGTEYEGWEISDSSYSFVKGGLPYGTYEYEVTFNDGIHETAKGEFVTDYTSQVPVDISVKHKTGDMSVRFFDQHQTEIKDEEFYVTFEFAEEASSDPSKKPQDVIVKAGETVTMSRGKYEYEVHVSDDTEPVSGGQIVFNESENTLDITVNLKAADLTDLKAAIAEGKKKDGEQDLYTERSWNHLQQAIEDAEDLVGRENELTVANDPEIKEAAKAIRDAIENLTQKAFADLDELKEVLAEAERMSSDDVYTGDSQAMSSLRAIIDEIQAIVARKPEIEEQGEIDKLIQPKKDALKEIAKNVVTSVIEEITAKKNDSGKTYTQSSLDACEKVLEEATHHVSDWYGNATIDVLEKAVKNLRNVVLVEKANYSALDDLKDISQYSSDMYTPESYNKLLAAAQRAESLDKDLPITEQQQIDDLCKELENAITGLKYKPADRLDILHQSLTAAKAKKEENKDIYDENSLTRLDNAIAAAEGLLDATVEKQTEVDKAIEELVAAMTEATKQKADYTRLTAAKETASGKNKNAYTADSYNNLLQALAEANAVPDDLTKDQQSVVDAAASDLEAAIEALEGKMNLTDLRELYEEAEAITDKETYTTDSWNAFVQSRDAAKVYIDQYEGQADDNIPYDEGEQQKIDAATEDLAAKKGALVERADFTKLDNAIKAAGEYLQKETDYTPDSWKAFKTSYESAQAAANEDRANVPVTDQERLDNLADVLTTAIDALKIEKSNLEEQIQRAEDANVDEHRDWYTSLDDFDNALSEANEKYNDDTATKAEVDEAASALKNAIDNLPNLLKAADYSNLETAISDAETAYADETFTDDSRASLLAVLEQARTLNTQEPKLKIDKQSTIDDMVSALNDAVTKLAKKPADTTAMDAAIADAQSKIKEGNYSAKSLADLQEALKKAQDVRNRDGLNIDDQNDVNAATKELTEKIDALEKLADKTSLRAAIENVADYEESNYTKASWALVVEAKAEAEALMSEEITEADETENHRIADAVTALNDALEALQRVASKKPLEDALAEYRKYVASNYTEDSWSKVTAALEKVNNLMDEDEIPESRTAEVTEAANALHKALEEAELKPADYSSLEAAKDLVTQDILDEKDTYTEDTWNAFENAYAEAESLLAAKDLKITDQQKVNDAARKLTDAVEGLTKKPAVYEELDAAIEKAEGLDESKYTKESWKTVSDALKSARDVARDLTIDDQAAVDEAAGKLTDAIDALLELADTSALKKDIADVSSLDESIYTEDSWAKVQDAIDAAEALLNGEITKDSQNLVDEAVSAIKEAVDALEKKPADYKDLEDTLAKALGFKEEDYTAKSWAALQDAIAKAEAVADDLKIDEQDKIDEAIDSLKTAIEGMRQKSETGTIIIRIKDEDGNPLPKVPLNLSKVRETSGIARIALFRLLALSNEDEIGTFYTDANGVSEISELEFGKYHITSDYVTENGIEVHIDQFIQLTKDTAEEGLEIIVIAKYPATVTASVGVTDENGNSVESEVADGIEIEILKDGEVFKSFTTKDGKIEADLPYGTYTARLKSVPEGYEATISEEEFTITKDHKTFDLQLKISKKKETPDTPVEPSKPNTGVSGGYSGRFDSDSGSSSSSTKNGAVNGTWTYDSVKDRWTLNNHQYRNQWVYAFNGYASADQGQYDWFYFDANGDMVTGWFTDTDGRTYYLHETSDGTRGAMETGWKWIGGKCYYFHEVSDGTKGHLLKSTRTPDGYTVDATGAWVVDGIVITR